MFASSDKMRDFDEDDGEPLEILENLIERLVPEVASVGDQNLVTLVNIVLEKLTADNRNLSALEQLALLIAVRKKLSDTNQRDHDMTELIKSICNQTGLVEFIKHCGSALNV